VQSVERETEIKIIKRERDEVLTQKMEFQLLVKSLKVRCFECICEFDFRSRIRS
jgi:hypothetical protein